MITTINKNRIYISVLLIICLILLSQLFQKCENEKLQLANIKALNSQTKVYKLKNGQLVTSVENLHYTNSQLKNSLLMKDKNVKELVNKFSNVKSVTKYVTNTKFDTIKLVYKYNSKILDPHSSVGLKALENYYLDNSKKSENLFCLETAHPAKFRETIYKILKRNPKIPSGISKNLKKKEFYKVLPNNLNKIKNYIKANRLH